MEAQPSRLAQAAAQSQSLVYLNEAGVVELTPTTALVGHDGWGDARLGTFDSSEILLNDFLLIDELRADGPTPWEINRDILRRTLNSLGDEAAAHLARVLPEALRTHDRVVLLTHVPPFREAAWHEGSPSDDDWLPFFACKAVGDVILEVMAAHADCRLLVLCGHTHGGQICLPGGIPLYRNAPGCRREHLAGSWREGAMIGYTSRGTGSAGVAARFCCPPEVTIHILREKKSET